MPAKKSNKTAHVLGLITNGKQDTPDTNHSPTSTQKTSVSNSKTSDTISSVEIKRPDDTSHLSEIIKEKLIEEFEPQQNTKTSETVIEKNTEKESFLQTQSFEEQETQTPKTIPAESPEKESSQNQNKSQEKSEEDNKIILDTENYVYINVMETFVKEIIMDYMQQYGSCTCNHCIIDTMALALTNLPSKYIVAEKGGLFPRMNVYRTKYATQISTEVLKACLTVGKFPHHNR